MELTFPSRTNRVCSVSAAPATTISSMGDGRGHRRFHCCAYVDTGCSKLALTLANG